MTPALTERLIWAAVVVVALFLGIAYERHQGAQHCVEADTKAAAAQAVSVAHSSGQAEEKVKEESTTYAHATEHPASGPVYRVQPAAVPAHTCPVLPASAPAGRADAAAPVPEPHPEPSPATWDSSGVVTDGRDADAQIAALQSYIRDVCHQPGPR